MDVFSFWIIRIKAFWCQAQKAGLDIRPLLPYLKREPRPLREQEPGLARRG